jgi:drug/metabolite transporter (DMT)-like permease
MNAIAMGISAVMLLASSVIADESRTIPNEGATWVALTYLVLAGSIGVFWLYVVVLSEWSASAASYQLVLIPIITVALSAWFQDETITWAFGVGSVLVLAGVYFGVLRRPLPSAHHVRYRNTGD